MLTGYYKATGKEAETLTWAFRPRLRPQKAAGGKYTGPVRFSKHKMTKINQQLLNWKCPTWRDFGLCCRIGVSMTLILMTRLFTEVLLNFNTIWYKWAYTNYIIKLITLITLPPRDGIGTKMNIHYINIRWVARKNSSLYELHTAWGRWHPPNCFTLGSRPDKIKQKFGGHKQKWGNDQRQKEINLKFIQLLFENTV